MLIVLASFVAGLLLGTAGGLGSATVLWKTRPQRAARRRLFFVLGYITVAFSVLSTLIILRSICFYMGMRQADSNYHDAQLIYALGYASVAALAIRSELKWRKSLKQTTVIPPAF
jgi:hypothetical protein